MDSKQASALTNGDVFDSPFSDRVFTVNGEPRVVAYGNVEVECLDADGVRVLTLDPDELVKLHVA